MAKGVSSDFGTGGMATKIAAARIANDSGADMIIANGADFGILNDIMEGKEIGTLFLAHKNPNLEFLYVFVKSIIERLNNIDKLFKCSLIIVSIMYLFILFYIDIIQVSIKIVK